MAIDTQNLPRHVAIIMDGNGRWARRQGKIRSAGHSAGVTRAKEIVGAAAALGIPFVTLYIFSTENWKRAHEEVDYLMGLVHKHLKNEFDFYKKNGIRLKHLGDIEGLPGDVRADIEDAVRDTASFTGTTLVMAINYGGRDEIVRALRRIAIGSGDAPRGVLDAADITEESIERAFDVPELPDVDLLIRTGGEERLSNFLLWHASYAELIFKDTLWPDYTKEEFYADIESYQHRTRRFGAESPAASRRAVPDGVEAAQ